MSKLNLNAWGSNHKVTFETSRYCQNGNLCVKLLCWDDGYPEPWSNLTVNLGIALPSNMAFIDTNNNGEAIIDWLEKHNIGQLTGRVQTSGWCSYPEFKFNMDKIKQYM